MLQAGGWRLVGRFGLAAFALALLLASVSALAQNEVIGKIQAKLDGQDMTWYVLRDAKTGQPGAIWMSHDDASRKAMISGYESKDVGFSKDANGLPSVRGEGSLIGLTFDFNANEGSVDYQLPSVGADPVSILFMPVLNDYQSILFLTEGHFSVSKITLDGVSGASFTGSFSGRLQTKAGETHELTDGHFDLSGGKQFQP